MSLETPPNRLQLFCLVLNLALACLCAADGGQQPHVLQEEDSCQASRAEGMDRRTSIYGFCSTHLWLHSGQLDMLHWSSCRAFSNAAIALPA